MGIQKAMQLQAAEAFSDDQIAFFAVTEFKAGRMDREDATSALRLAGRYEAEIKEKLS